MRKLLTILLVVFIMFNSSFSLSAESEQPFISYSLDYSTLTNDDLKDYITSIQAVQDGGGYQIQVGENGEKYVAGYISGNSGSVSFSPHNINLTGNVVINVDIDSKTASVNYTTTRVTEYFHTATVRIYPSPLSEDTTMWCDIYLDGSLQDTRKANPTDNEFHFGSYSHTFAPEAVLSIDDIYINSSGYAVVESTQIEGGVISRYMGNGTRELEIFMETHVPAQELELDYLRLLRPLNWDYAKQETAHYSNAQINQALASSSITLKNNGTGLTTNERLVTTITYWERLNNGAIIGDGIYNTQVAPRQIQVICQYYDNATEDCSSVKSLPRYYAVIADTYSYGTVVKKPDELRRNEIIWESKGESSSFPTLARDEDLKYQYQFQTANSYDSGWLTKDDYNREKNDNENFHKVTNEQTRDASRYTYRSYSGWSNWYPQTEAPYWYAYYGTWNYEAQNGSDIYRYKYVDAFTGWVNETPTSGAYTYSHYDYKVQTQKQSCTRHNASGYACGWSEWTGYDYDSCISNEWINCDSQVETRNQTRTCHTYYSNGNVCGWGAWTNYDYDSCSNSNAVNCGSREETRYQTRAAKSCVSAGCKVYSSWSSWSSWTTSSCFPGSYRECQSKIQKKTCTSRYLNGTCKTWSGWSDASSCSAQANRTQCQTLTRSRTRSCHAYNVNADVCGYTDWGSYSSWSASSCTDTSTKRCETRTRYRKRYGNSCSSAGCQYWNNWGGYTSWSTNSCTNSDTKRCETRTRYKKQIGLECSSAGCATWTGWSDASSCTSQTNVTNCQNVYQYKYYKWSDWTSWSTSVPPAWILNMKDYDIQSDVQVRARKYDTVTTGWYPGASCTGSDCPRQEDVISTMSYYSTYGEWYQYRGTFWSWSGTYSQWFDVPDSQTTGYSAENIKYRYRVMKATIQNKTKNDDFAIEGSVTIGTKPKQTYSDIVSQAHAMDKADADQQLLLLVRNGALSSEYNKLGNENILWSEFSNAKSGEYSSYIAAANNSISGDTWLASNSFVPYIYITDHIRANYVDKDIVGYSEDSGNMNVSLTEVRRDNNSKSSSGILVQDDNRSALNTKVVYLDFNTPLKKYEGNLPDNWDGEAYNKFVEAIANAKLNDMEGEIRIKMSLQDMRDMREYLKEHPDSLGDCGFLKEFSHIFESTSSDLSAFLSGSDSCRIIEEPEAGGGE